MEIGEQVSSLLETAALLMVSNAHCRLTSAQFSSLATYVRALVRTAGVLVVTNIHVLSPAFQGEAFHLIREIELTVRVKGHGRF